MSETDTPFNPDPKAPPLFFDKVRGYLENIGFSRETVIGITKALFLLVLAITGNFLAELLSCQTQRLMSSMFAKHIMLFFMIYFTLDFSSSGHDHPSYILAKSILIWTVFHIFSRTDLIYTIVSFSMLAVVYVISNYRDYYSQEFNSKSGGVRTDKKFTEDYNTMDDWLRNIQISLFATTIIVLLWGFAKYYIAKKHEYTTKFSWKEFFEGHVKCKGSKKAMHF